MRRTRTLLLGLGIGLLAAAGCQKASEAPQAGKAEPKSPDTILIGHYGSLTGSEATFGQSTDNGIKLAIKERNAAGGVNGKQVLLKTYDTQGKSQEAGTAVTRLITDDKVTALLGEVASSLSIAGGRVAQQYGVPMITPSSTNPQVTQIGDMIFRVCFLDSFQGYAVAKFSKETLKAQKVAVLYDQAQAYSKGLKDDFSKAFSELGGTITTQQAYTGGDQDFSAQLTTIRGTNPDAIFVPGYYTDAGNVSLQARKLGIKVPLLGGDGWDSSKLAEIGGSAIEGSYFCNHYSHQEPRPEVKSFVAAYQNDFGQVPDGLAALGYDAARLLFDAMSRAASLSGKDLAAAIAATKDFPGVTGKITIDANRNARKSAVILEMKGGIPSFVASVEPPQ
ncbi:MAG: ABC transporter substrate-binding protein [Acidobacteria bacterium]|nr:ABC transporter substrate-binding protein [Acidobacteriota bacterium]MCK6683033.1 ABC transporter substrate-binding protein [Thermoanaerobaculia bacterium]